MDTDFDTLRHTLVPDGIRPGDGYWTRLGTLPPAERTRRLGETFCAVTMELLVAWITMDPTPPGAAELAERYLDAITGHELRCARECGATIDDAFVAALFTRLRIAVEEFRANDGTLAVVVRQGLHGAPPPAGSRTRD